MNSVPALTRRTVGATAKAFAPLAFKLHQISTRAILSNATAASAASAYPNHDNGSFQNELFVPPTRPNIQVNEFSDRMAAIKNAKPFSEFLTDNFNRQHNYLRLYCMPEEGIDLSPPSHLLTTQEILHLAKIFVAQGVTKIRLTGGEPTVRKDIVELVTELGKLKSIGLKEIAITSNGISLARKLPQMVQGGLTALNLSLDTLDEFKFQFMTRRKGLSNVLKSIDTALSLGIQPLKLNCVVMNKVNADEIPSFIAMTKDQPIEVRFIEYMPFAGNKWSSGKMITYQEMLDTIRQLHPDLEKVRDHKNDTSKTYQIPGYQGKLGFITSMTHNFCGTCNRLRITSDGNIKVCLFDNAEVSLRDLLRANGGMGPDGEKRLLEIIGVAVKGKKEKHAGLGELERYGHRPLLSSKIASTIPLHSLAPSTMQSSRLYSISTKSNQTPPITKPEKSTSSSKLTHVLLSGAAYMVPIHDKQVTTRTAKAVSTVRFSNQKAIELIRSNSNKKGDVLSISRIAGIMAAKKTSDIIPLCHPIPISRVEVNLRIVDDLGAEGDNNSKIEILTIVTCDGKTGVEMEALTAAMSSALAVYDMCKAVDKGMIIDGTRVVEKIGGKSGDWREDDWVEWSEL
ncbi:hypothetical protein H072_2782 [Dactylellina haptotyla CBS 200.50]|uniref:cyclic pyranopterin monophosphate synthase n=1 Tax=Dactylellina haptotyla (strain CBS 200.50) TaxID=1284197 RepID=S8BUV3_DACHA|nr:hypothetical protein H072_2782 [Dactylellina haptotyla CBS 200.50]